jgi:type II secretory pathway component PulF
VSHAAASFPRNLTLDELIAFNDEIVLLARAGVPLDKGLVEVAGDISGRAGAFSESLGRRLASGESLQQIVQQDGKVFPPVYAAVVTAGLRAGRLPAALECLATSLRRVAELQRTVRFALVYPLLVAGVAYVFFLVSVVFLSPRLAAGFAQIDGWQDPVPRLILLPSRTLWWWVAVPPALLVALLVLLSRRRAGVLRAAAWRNSRLRRGLVARGRLAIFAEMLALLVEQQTTLDQALELAGDSCGDAELQRGARQLADAVRQGQRFESLHAPSAVPPLLVCLLFSGATASQLTRRLRWQADKLQHQANAYALRLQALLPLVLTLLVGGTAVVAYATWVLWPWIYLLWDMGLVGK